MKTYPEHEKLSAINEETQFLGSFIDWLGNNGMIICAYNEMDYLYPVNKGINGLLAEYKNIDLNKIEAEKREMLADLQSLNHA